MADDEKTARLSFDISEAEKQLNDLENHLARLARKAEGIQIGGGGATGGGASAGAPSAGSALGGGNLEARLDALVTALERRERSDGGGGGSGGGGKKPASLWTDDAVSDFARENRKAPEEKKSNFSGFGAVAGAIGGAATGSNPVSGFMSILGAGAGAINPLLGGLVNAAGSAISGILAAGDKHVEFVKAQLPALVQMQGNYRGVPPPDAHQRLSNAAHKWGVDPTEAIQLQTSELASSRLRNPDDPAQLAMYKRAGIDMGTAGAWRGGARAAGGTAGNAPNLLSFASLSEDVGLDPNVLPRIAAGTRQMMASKGADIDASKYLDFMQRAYATENGASQGTSLLDIGDSMARNSITARDKMGGGLGDVMGTLAQARGYEAARAAGKTGIEGIAFARDFTANETLEDQILGARKSGFSEKDANGLLAITAGTSLAAASALGDVAGKDGARRAGTGIVAGISDKDMSTQTMDIQKAVADEANRFFGDLGNSEVFKTIIRTQGTWEAGVRDFASAAASIRSIFIR
jgi:hypothetical protein